MQLTNAQLEEFERGGWLFLENLFSAEEVAVLMSDVPRIFALKREEVVREKDGETPRTAFAAQYYSEPFQRLSRHPRLIEPVRQILDGEGYIHQFAQQGLSVHHPWYLNCLQLYQRNPPHSGSP